MIEFLNEFLNEALMKFRSCFSRQATFSWFVVIVVGLMIRQDYLGVTSVIRSLCLYPCYELLIGFFRSSAWSLEVLTEKWCQFVRDSVPLVKVGGAVILPGDGVKQGKEGRKMPGVKKLHQESENSSKAEYIFGHQFGAVGVMAEPVAGKDFCIPLAVAIHDGVKGILGWVNSQERQGSHVVEMIKLAYRIAEHFEKAYLVLDRLFLTVPALITLDALNKAGKAMVHIVTKAKRNCVAYQEPEARTGKRGRPAKRGAPVKLYQHFNDRRSLFQTSEVTLYGKIEKVSYLHVDLLWGIKLYQKLRFVFVEYGGLANILVTTDLKLQPIDIIQIYGKRFSIECMFREMKQVVSAFGYRFWSKYMPKLNRFRKKDDPDPVMAITDKHAQKRIGLAIKAYEGYVFCCAVAIGLLQILSIKFSGENRPSNVRYMRTPTKTALSESTVAEYLRRNIYSLLLKHADLGITRIIQAKQTALDEQYDEKEAS